MLSNSEKEARDECIRIIMRRGLSRRKARQSARFGAVHQGSYIKALEAFHKAGYK